MLNDDRNARLAGTPTAMTDPPEHGQDPNNDGDGDVTDVTDVTAAAVAVQLARARESVTALTGDRERIVEHAAYAPPDDEHDPEGATVAFEREQVSAVLAATRERVAALQKTQQRLVDGEAFVCEACGGPIPPGRLMVRPTAHVCVRCAGTP